MKVSRFPPRNFNPTHGIRGFKSRQEAEKVRSELIERYWPKLLSSVSVMFENEKISEWVIMLCITDDLVGDIMIANLEKEFGEENAIVKI